MSSEGSVVHYEVAPPFVEGTEVSRARSFRVRRERSGRTFDPWLVFDSVENMIDGYSEWDEVELCFIFLAGFGSTPGWLVDSGGVVARTLPRGNCDFDFSTLGPYLGRRLNVARVASTIWMYFYARIRISLILVILFFIRCL